MVLGSIYILWRLGQQVAVTVQAAAWLVDSTLIKWAAAPPPPTLPLTEELMSRTRSRINGSSLFAGAADAGLRHHWLHSGYATDRPAMMWKRGSTNYTRHSLRWTTAHDSEKLRLADIYGSRWSNKECLMSMLRIHAVYVSDVLLHLWGSSSARHIRSLFLEMQHCLSTQCCNHCLLEWTWISHAINLKRLLANSSTSGSIIHSVLVFILKNGSFGVALQRTRLRRTSPLIRFSSNGPAAAAISRQEKPFNASITQRCKRDSVESPPDWLTIISVSGEQ